MVNKNIPVIGIPIVNGVHWLERLIKSIDYPVDNVFIINNNGRNNITKELNKLNNINNKFIKKLHITHLPTNIGVATAWNLIIKSYLMEPYWVIANHDVAFTPGLLEEIAQEAINKDITMIHPHAANYNLGSYDLFVITEKGVRDIGLFDENLYPAYGEDCDFIMRIENIKPKTVKGLKNIHIHGFEKAKDDDKHYEKNAQQTKKEEPKLIKKLKEINFTNFKYLNEKWGEGWRNVKPHWDPFQNPELPQSYTTWDIDFNRSKYLGF